MSGWKGRNPGQSWKSQENQWYQWLGLRKMTHDYPTLKTWFSQNSNRCHIQSWNTIFVKKKTLPSRGAGSMPVASFFGKVKTYFIYFSENYIAFAISRTEVRFWVILGKINNALTKAGGEQCCLVDLWNSLSFWHVKSVKAENQWRTEIEEK